MPYMTEDAQLRQQWYAEHGCTHAHCPFECEHPQPQFDGGVLVCGRCLVLEGRRTPMLACIPGVCT